MINPHRIQMITAIRRGFKDHYGFSPDLLTTKQLVDVICRSEKPEAKKFVQAVNLGFAEKNAEAKAKEILRHVEEHNAGWTTKSEFVKRITALS